jgi:ammonium transporter, Amt family
VIAVGLFADDNRMAAAYPVAKAGAFYGGGADMLICQLAEIGFILGWVTVVMTPFFVALKMAGMFRVDPLEEEVGLDISHHRGAAYDWTGPSKNHLEDLMEVRAARHGKVDAPKEVTDAAVEADDDESS